MSKPESKLIDRLAEAAQDNHDSYLMARSSAEYWRGEAERWEAIARTNFVDQQAANEDVARLEAEVEQMEIKLRTVQAGQSDGEYPPPSSF